MTGRRGGVWRRASAAWCLLLAGCAKSPETLFVDYYHPDPRRELAVLLDHDAGAQPSLAPLPLRHDGYRRRIDHAPTTLPFADLPSALPHCLGLLPARGDGAPALTLLVDYAGEASAAGAIAEHAIRQTLLLRFDLRCEGDAATCQHDTVPPPQFFQPFDDGRAVADPALRQVDTRQRFAVSAAYPLALPAGRPLAVYLSAWAGPDLLPERLRLRLVEGPISTQRPRAVVDGEALLLATGIFLAVLGSAVWRLRRGAAADNPEAPRQLGLLLAVWGLLLALAGWRVLDDLYFLVVGLLFVAIGRCLLFGQFLALPLALFTLVTVWGWSLADLVGQQWTPLLLQAGLPSLVCLYLLFGGLSDRLGRPRR